MTMLHYKSDKFHDDGGLLQGCQINDKKSENNKNNVYLLLKR